MAVEVKVVQDLGDNLLGDIFIWDGNMPLWADKWFKSATPDQHSGVFRQDLYEKKRPKD